MMIALKGVIVRDRASIVVEVEHNLGAKNDIAGGLSRGAMTSFSLTLVINVMIK